MFTFSCSKKDVMMEKDFSARFYPQTWKLFKMTGSFENSETTGEAMAWQEEYTFYSNGSVEKLRPREGESSGITGNYSFFQEDERQGILIEYEFENSLTGSCTGKEETLYFDPTGTILNSSWWACDGPGLFYKRK